MIVWLNTVKKEMMHSLSCESFDNISPIDLSILPFVLISQVTQKIESINQHLKPLINDLFLENSCQNLLSLDTNCLIILNILLKLKLDLVTLSEQITLQQLHSFNKFKLVISNEFMLNDQDIIQSINQVVIMI